MREQKRKVLLLVDNASSHAFLGPGAVQSTARKFKRLQLSNVTILFLPPNTTAIIQPLDAGIIQAFKLREAWRSLEEQLIQNCWRKTRLLPLTWNHDICNGDEHVRCCLDSEANKLAGLIAKLDFGVGTLPVIEYLAMDPVDIESEYTDDELVRCVLNQSTWENILADEGLDIEETQDVDVNDLYPPLVSISDARRAASSLLQFICDNPQFALNAEVALIQIQTTLAKMTVANFNRFSQRTLDSFYHRES
ncbi:hypothetical protein R1sor_027146 [Riccia sorocarpa]|uniref:DDE-1 domain-containing protein n=1 Tax=Riccia sorocarpa TaxID=122646 RepID=A0ABD3GE39_9MARC